MTVTPEKVDLPASVAATYRAKDVEMAATIDVARRTVLITGAIDTNDHDILVRIELPDAGRWNVVKSETNLTDLAWSAWQITLGEGTYVVVDGDAQNLCRQYQSLYVADDRQRLCFYDGEVRPGEAVLKLFTLETKVRRILMAHTRAAEEDDDPEEVEEPATPVTPDDPEAKIRAGLPAKPFIEAFLPTTIVGR